MEDVERGAHDAHRGPMIGLLAANTISKVGNLMTFVAAPWFVLQTTGSAALTGFTAFCAALPLVIGGMFGGAFVDRLGFKRTSILADLASGVTVAMIPLLHLTVGLAFWQLILLIFLTNLLDTPGTTARQSLRPQVASHGRVSLERVSAAAQMCQGAAGLVGPILAGFLIGAIGVHNVLWIDALTFVGSALLTATMIPGDATPAPARERRDYRDEIVEGLRFVWNERLIRSIVLMGVGVNFLATPLFAVIFPVYASRVFGDSIQLGAMFAGFASGVLIGTLAFIALSERLPRRGVFLVAPFITTFAFSVLTTRPSLLLTVGALVVMGIAAGPIRPLLITLTLEHTPARLRGRVIGIQSALEWTSMPIGMLTAGFLLEEFSLRFTLTGVAIAFLAISVWSLFNRTLCDARLAPAAAGRSMAP